MKRSRDDGSFLVMRSSEASPGESFGQSPNTGDESGGAKPTADDAFEYLQTVKLIFQDQQEKYGQFLSIMKEFKGQRTSTEEVIARVKELFKGHDNLIYGFNTFLPEGYKISLDEDDSHSQPVRVEFKEAIGFVEKVKKHFRDKEHIYSTFIDILTMYHKEDKDIDELYGKVAELFEDHPDLLDEFTKFLPNNSATTSAPHPRYDDQGTPMLPLQQLSSDDQDWRRERALAERDLSTGLADIDEQRITLKSHKDQRKREKDSRDRRIRILEGRAAEHDAVRDLNSQRYSEKKKPARWEGLTLVPYDDRNALKSIYSREFTFCDRVKEKLGNSDDYQAFLKCLNVYNTEIITRTEMRNLVSDLLGKYPDLMEGFNVFLKSCENLDGFLAGVTSKRSLWSDQHLTRSTKSDGKDKKSKRDTEAAKEKEEKYWKSIQDLDLSKCQRCTPSYRLLPKDYPIDTTSQRTELGAQVLNDHWVSVTSGSEDYSFKHMRRNQYEESLFKCEDDRFELDMLIESVSSTAKRAEDLLNNINHNKIRADVSICVEDHFTAIHIRCIERLYGDHGLDALDTLRKYPAQALPAILNRLKQKQDEWTMCRSGYDKIWAEIFAKNHYKSLDHRSFYFKQQDSMTLSMKSFVAEIKRKKEIIQEDDSLLFSVAAAYKRPLVPHLELFFPDAEVHRDICKIIKFSCEELCSTKEQLNKVMKFWYTFCEPMLGVVCQPQAADNAEDHHTNASNGSAGSMEIDARNVSVANAAVSKQREHVASANDNFSRTAKPTPRELGSNATISGAQLSHPVPNSAGGAHDQKRSANAKQSEVVSARKRTRPDGSRIKHRRKESSRSLRSEREEGELSPHGYFEEYDSFSCWDTSRLATGNASEASGESGDYEFSRGGHEEGEYAENEELSRKTESGSDADVYHNGRLQPAQFLKNAKPLKRYISSEIECPDQKCSRVFYGNNDFYVLFRLHSALYERIMMAKTSPYSSEAEQRDSRETSSTHPYSSFMIALFSFLDGSLDNAKYENECEAVYGKQAYILFTLDKLLYRLVKQLQAIVADEIDKKLLQLFEYEASRTSTKWNDSVYHENLLVLPLDEKDNLYRIKYSSDPARLSIHLMDKDCDKSEAFAVSVEPKFSKYLQNDFLSATNRSKKEPGKTFLRRNKRRYAGVDDKSAAALVIEDAQLLNGLEYKMLCRTSKIFYVLGTEDFFYQPPGKRCNLTAEQSAKRNLARARRFLKKLPSA